MASEGFKNFAKRYLSRYSEYNECFLRAYRVDMFSGKEKAKGTTRIMALSSYRLLLIKKEQVRKTRIVTKNIHYYDLQEIVSENENSATFFFRGKHANKSIFIKSGNIVEIIQTIRERYNSMTVGYSSLAAMKVTVSYPLDPVDEPRVSEIANGLLDLYLSQSAYFGTNVSQELIHYVEDQVEFDKSWVGGGESEEWLHTDANPLFYSPYALELHKIPGIVRNNPISFNLHPIAAALRHNTYFRALRLCNVQNLKDMILLVANIIRHNRNLSRIELVNLGASKYFLALGDMLRDNQDHTVQYLSLSGSNITTTGILSISIALQKFTHILKGLDLSRCGLNKNRLEILMNAFRRNYAMSISIEELNLSNNHFDTESSKSMEKWLFEAKEFSKLRKLEVGSSNLNMMVVSRAFRALKYLQKLDISHNKLDQGAVELLCIAIDESHTLQCLVIASCSLKPPFIQKIVSALFGNRTLKDLVLDFSFNQCASKSSSLLAESFKSAHNLHTLYAKGYKWKPEAVVSLLAALATKKSLDTLVLDGSCRKTKTGSEELSRALYVTLKHTPSLKALSLCGGFSLVVPSFLDHLQKNSSLLELSIDSNTLGDSGAYQIAELLRVHPSLLFLSCDGNQIGWNGWKSIHLSFEVNTNLLHLPYPWEDVKSAPSAIQVSLRTTLNEVQHHIHSHSPSILRKYSFLSPSEEVHTPPACVEPLPNIPKHLLLLQKEAQLQFEEKKLYWLSNDGDNLPDALPIECCEESEWGYSDGAGFTQDEEAQPIIDDEIPSRPTLPSSSSLSELLGSKPNKPMPSPLR